MERPNLWGLVAGRLAALLASLALAGGAFAQGPPAAATIEGRVVDESGAPIANADVRFEEVGGARETATLVSTDEEGRFVADVPARGAYYGAASSGAYVDAEGSTWGRRIYRAGDTALFRLSKGGAITGRVVAAGGEPVVEIPVHAYRVRDERGRDVAAETFPYRMQTDDRGVYRFFGLPAGGYLVSAGGGEGHPWAVNFYGRWAQVYHPSATRRGAAEVQVRLGGETDGVDIAYRRVEGRTISGVVTGAVRSGSVGATVYVLDAATSSTMHIAFGVGESGGAEFSVTGVSDGEYEVYARAQADAAESEPRRVVVRGADVSGVELRLAPLSSLAGRVVWEERPRAEGYPEPRPRREGETVVGFRRDDPKRATQPVEAPAGERGEFSLAGLRPGPHRLRMLLPDERWYVAAVERERAGAARGARRENVAAGVAVARGEQVRGVVVTLRSGAASVAGRATREDGAPPGRATVVLVPAEPEAAAELLRYYAAEVAGDGAFTARNLAPGRYLVVLRPESDERFSADELGRLASDPKRRALLLEEARAAGLAVELAPCQRLDGVVVPTGRR